MNARRFPYRGPSFVKTFFYSFLFHSIILFLVLSIPIYSGGASYGSYGGEYSVYLSSEGPAERPRRPQRAAVTRMENASEPAGKGKPSVEENAQSNPPQLDKEETPATEEEESGSKVVEAPAMKEVLPPGVTGQGPVPEENEVKQEADIAEPATENIVEKAKKGDISERDQLTALNVADGNTVSAPDQTKKPEKKPDIIAEKPPKQMDDDKKVMPEELRREHGKALPREEVPVPAIKQEMPEKDVKTLPMQSPAAPPQKVEPITAKTVTVASETSKEVTMPPSMQERGSPQPPDVKLTPEPNPAASEEKPLQDISVTPAVSPVMTLPIPEEKAVSSAIETAQSIGPPVSPAKNDEKNNKPKVEVAKQVDEAGGKTVPPKFLTRHGESSVEKEIKARGAGALLPGKDSARIKGNGKTPARDIDQGGTQTFLPAISSGREEAADHKKSAGGDTSAANAPKQTIQKIDDAGGSHYDQLKRLPDAPQKSAGMGSQKPDRELQTNGGENTSLLRLAGSESGKKRTALHLESKLAGQLRTVFGDLPEGPSLGGTKNGQPLQPAAEQGLANSGGAHTDVSPDVRNLPSSALEKKAEPEPAVLAAGEEEAGKSRIGIPVSEALIQKDISIEVFLEGLDRPAVLTKLFKKSHPELRRRRDRERQETVAGTVENTISREPGKTGTRHVFSVTNAEKAAYTFVLENKGEEARTVDVIFRFYEGREKERDKEYHSRALAPGGMLRFTFIMPEGIFWDDEDRFSGMVEDSRTITKFNNESGLVWKEEKGY
jgi:hypothetical protein